MSHIIKLEPLVDRDFTCQDEIIPNEVNLYQDFYSIIYGLSASKVRLKC